MAIRNSYAAYVDVFNKCPSNDYIKVKSNLKKLMVTEIIYKVILFLILLSLVAMVVGMTKDGEVVFAIIPIGIAWAIFILPLKALINYFHIQLDEELFNKFLIENLQIFYSMDELKDYSYTKMEHITSSDSQGPKNQVVKNISFEAYEKGAEGVIITDQSTASHTSGKIGRKTGGEIKTTIINSAEGILIKDIKRKKEKNIDSGDIEYWYGLLEKGAITQDEYNAKKETLL